MRTTGNTFGHYCAHVLIWWWIGTDNPPSDIQGANNKGAPWQSCLVRTGNFHGADNDPTFPAHHVFKDAHTVVTTMLVSFRVTVPAWLVGCGHCRQCAIMSACIQQRHSIRGGFSLCLPGH